MELSPQQDEALKAVARWLKAGKPQIFRLFGYAGTGKTTLARYFAEHVDGQVQFAAFTGKAAQVLRSKGAVNARTIHSLIYRPRGEEAVADEATGKTSMSPTFSAATSTTIWSGMRSLTPPAGRRTCARSTTSPAGRRSS